MQAALAVLETRVDERQREQRLADARRPDRERRVATRDAAADRGVELRQPERRRDRPARRRASAASSPGAGTPRTPALLSRKLCWPDIDLRAAQLQDTQPTAVDRAVGFVLELDDAVGDGELRLRARLFARRIRRPGSALHRCRRPCSRGRRSARLNSPGSTTSCSALLLSMTITAGLLSTLRRRISSAAPVESCCVVVDEVGQVDELDALAERVVVEERERLEVAHQLVVRLRPGRVVQRRALGRRVREADLLCEDRLAAARRARRSRSASLPRRLRRESCRGRRRRSSARSWPLHQLVAHWPAAPAGRTACGRTRPLPCAAPSRGSS